MKQKKKEKIVAHLRLRFSLHFESTAFTVVTAPSHTVTHLAAVHFICEWGSILGKAFRTLTLTECTHPFHFMQTCRFFLGENIISLSTSLDTRNVLSSQMLFIQSCYKFNRILLFSTLSPHHFFLSFYLSVCCTTVDLFYPSTWGNIVVSRVLMKNEKA